MLERTEGYLKSGYEVFWIAGEKFQLKKRMTPFQHLFLKQHPKIGLYFLYLNQEKKQLEVCSQIQQQQPGGHCRFNVYLIDLERPSVPLKKISERIFLEEKKIIPYFSYLKSHDYLVRGRLYQNPKMVEFQKYIYYRGDSLISLPKEIYLLVQNELLIQTIPHFWKYKLLEWLSNKGEGSILSKKELDHKINELVKQGGVAFYPAPFISEKTKKGIFYHYLFQLTEQNMLTAISSVEWAILRLPERYLNEREKLMDFKKWDVKKEQGIYLL